MNLEDLKKEYNYWLDRNRNAEIYFNTKSVNECIKNINLFNHITIKLSTLRDKLEELLKRKMTKQEILNGF